MAFILHDFYTVIRPISELIKTKEILKGYESQRLRSYCTSECLVPDRDLDAYGKLLSTGDINLVRLDFYASGPNREDTAKKIYSLRWGPTKIPVYNLLALLTRCHPDRRTAYINIARFLIDNGVAVDGTDLSGTTALSHSFSTKPAFDLEYAALLYNAGGDVNHRNRYGNTVAQEIVQVYNPSDKTLVASAKKALSWFLAHGGNVDIADGDGCTVRQTVYSATLLRKIGFIEIIEKEDKNRKAKGQTCCKLCGRADKTLLVCGRCKKAMYCSGRACQKTDWPSHKKACKP